MSSPNSKPFRNPVLFVISAPSGAGKTTLCQRLLTDFPNIRLSISTTTRAPRGKEVHGADYFFTSREDFEKQIRSDCFIEWALVHGNYYGTSKQVIEDSLNSGNSVLLDIDVHGSKSLKNAFGDRCITIFIAPPSIEELENRLRSRGTDSEASIQQRLQNARVEMEHAKSFDFQLLNDDLEKTYLKLREIIEASVRRNT